MNATVPVTPAASLPESFRSTRKQAKAALDLPNSVRKMDQWSLDAADCREANRLSGLESKEIAAALEFKSASQMSEQLAGHERPQTERWRHSEQLYPYYLMAQLKRRTDLFEMKTTILVKGPL